MTIAWADRYLAFLGVQPGEPGRGQLARIGTAQLRLVPFENVTSLLRRWTSPEGPVPEVDNRRVAGCLGAGQESDTRAPSGAPR
jgi:hypothetical protein